MNEQDFLPLLPTKLSEAELREINPIVLAFVGDSVQTLYVRSFLAVECAEKTCILHRKVAAIINATSQAEAMKRMMDIMSENELAVYKRCRNAKTNTSAKNASIIDYRIATGFEGVIGYLYLSGEHIRLAELLKYAYEKGDKGTSSQD